MRHGFTLALLSAALLAAIAAPVAAQEEIWVLTVSNNLINFMSNTPSTFTSRPITGMAAGEYAIGIDFRPALLGRLYALSNYGQLYRFDNPVTGAATAVGPGGIALSGTDFGFDFNPFVDRIRVISDADQNLRIHPDLGTLVATDTPLAYAGGDPNAGQNPAGTGAAYINNFSGTTTTTLYDIDSGLDVLVTQSPPNNGTLNTIGSLGLDIEGVNGFDVSGLTGIAYAALYTAGSAYSDFYTIDLATGFATFKGAIACNEALRGLSVNNSNPTPTHPSTWGHLKSIYR